MDVRTAPSIRLVDVRVVLVMPYEGIRHGLTVLLEGMRGLEVVAQSSSVSEGVDLVHRHAPDVVILDVDAARTVWTIHQIQKASPTSRVVVTVDEATRAEVEGHFATDAKDHGIHAVYPGQLMPTMRELLRGRKEAR